LRKTSVPDIEGGGELLSLCEKLLEEEEEKDDHWRGLLVFQIERERELQLQVQLLSVQC
jgi:hypothetical protein